VNSKYLGGLIATVLAASAIAAVPPGAEATARHAASPQDAHALARAAAHNLIASDAPQLRISAYDAFDAKPVMSSGGLQYAAYERTYRGLPVVGGDFVVVTDEAGHILNTSVAQTRKTSLESVTPKLSKAAASAISRRELDRADRVGASHLVVWQKAASHLAWDTRVTGTDAGEPSSKSVYVDALSGKVLGTQEHVLAGDGTAAYSGPNPLHLDTTLSGSTYSMKDPSTTNLSCQDAANNTTFSGPDDLWGNGVATSKETGCVDALFAAQTEKKMLSVWDGRNGMDGAGGAWPIRVGLNDLNAYYDGTQVQIGHNQSNQWIGSIDVLAHEMGHGVDDHTPGGISANGTQEFVADTFGAATEWYANEGSAYDPPDYTVGEEINLVGTGPIRYMYNPSLAGDSNCYTSSTPTDEVHAAAGPGNHWFYLLAEGTSPTDGQPTSPTCNSTTISGIGIQKAEKIMYNAMLMKTTSSSYLKYRTWTLTAAKNLYPGSCTEFNTVKAAWTAVSVPAQTGDPTCTTSGNTVTVNNPGNQTGTAGTAKTLQITATDSASGQTLTYSATGLPAGLSINSSTGLISGSPTTAATYSTTVKATDTTGATGSASFTFTISGTGGGCSGQKLGNPGFEAGTAAPWTASSGVIDSSTSEPARTGSWKAWLDGYGSSHTDTLTQSVSIPSGCSATLSFYLHIDTAETTTSVAYDKLTVKIGTTTLATYSNLNKGSGYTLRSFNVGSFAGQTVAVSFSGVEDSSLQTSFVIDDNSLNLS
jgi:Zn-dependent metalloprotease